MPLIAGGRKGTDVVLVEITFFPGGDADIPPPPPPTPPPPRGPPLKSPLLDYVKQLLNDSFWSDALGIHNHIISKHYSGNKTLSNF